MNKVILIGRMTKDSELRYTETNLAICDFSLAVDREYKKDEADFIKCKVFGKLGETINKYTKKGDLIAVCGRIQTGSFEKDGKKYYTFEIIPDSVKFLQTKKEETKVEDNPYKDMSVKVEASQQFEIKPEDLPF